MAPVPQAAVPQQHSEMAAVQGYIKGLEGKIDALLQSHQGLANEVKIAKNLAATALGALHHIYLSTGSLAQSTAGAAQTLPDFVKFMEKYLGGIANPS
jgi:prophage DNA circulation protein